MEEKKEREDLLPAGLVLDDRYHILRCIGIGGFGITYLCEDTKKERKVAVKEYFPAQWARREETYVMVRKSSMVQAFRFGMQSFIDEAEILVEFVKTPHIVTFYDIFHENDTVYLVMEYIDGISVGRMMRERGYQPYTPEEMAQILLPVLEGLRQMHKKGIIHGDVSPGNLMCRKDREICLIDLGAARCYKEKKPVLSAAFLKPEYAAPEQFRTARRGFSQEEGPWTDIYAVGAVMFYLLTGQRPPDAVSRAGGNELEKPAELSEKWMEIIRQCMALEIEKRIQEVRILTERIQKLLEEEQDDQHRDL